jgi:hypothetical protein
MIAAVSLRPPYLIFHQVHELVLLMGRTSSTKNLELQRAGLNDWVTMALDADGLGAGVYDRLVELGHSVGEIRGGMPSTEPDDYSNLRRVVLDAAPTLRTRRDRPRPVRQGAGQAAREDQVDDYLEGIDQDREQGRDAPSRPSIA